MSSGGGGAKKKKGGHEEHEEHVNHERWLVSYADMLTLLFVLFVVLFSMSDVNLKKFAQLANGLSEGFGAQSAAFDGKQSVLEGSGNNTEVIQIDPGAEKGSGKAGTSDMTSQEVQMVQNAMVAASRKEASQDAKAAAKEAENLKKVENKLSDALAKQKLLGQVKFTIDRRGLVVTIVTNEVVFAGNRADLQSGGKKILDALAPTLAKLKNNIEVDGNTNQLKAKTTYYPSGWELSAARASTTVRYLVGHGLGKGRMSAVGFSDTKPLIDPADPRSVTMNRRVDVVVLTTLSADQAALLPSAAGKDGELHTGQTTAQAEAIVKAAEQADSVADSTESSTESTTTTTSHD
jgi:chemotaxis protein MotB